MNRRTIWVNEKDIVDTNRVTVKFKDSDSTARVDLVDKNKVLSQYDMNKEIQKLLDVATQTIGQEPWRYVVRVEERPTMYGFIVTENELSKEIINESNRNERTEVLQA